MVGASVLGVFLQGLPPDRRVAMARVASLIRRAARGVRESKRFGLVFYELNGGTAFCTRIARQAPDAVCRRTQSGGTLLYIHRRFRHKTVSD